MLVTALLLVAAANPAPTRLDCEAFTNPLGIDVPHPRLTWLLTDPRPMARQTAYQIEVVRQSTGFAHPDAWNTGKVMSDNTLNVPYMGEPLKSGERVYWRVRTWDQAGQASAWSQPASWTMHLLKPSDWKAQWIGADGGEDRRKGIGYHAAEASTLDETKWVQVDLGRSLPLQSVTVYPVRHHLEYATFGYPLQYRVEAANDPDFAHPFTPIATQSRVELNPPDTMTARIFETGPIRARYVRVTATKLWARKDGVGCFALAELAVKSGGKNVALNRPVTAKDSVENYGWSKAALTDGADDEHPTYQTYYLRHEFSCAKRPVRALAFVSGLGQYELRIDGHKVGKDWITPGWTQYQKTVLADTYDVTALLANRKPSGGNHAIGIEVGTGMYNMLGDTRGSQEQTSLGALKARCQLQIEFADGTKQIVASDGTWKWHPTPATYAGVYGGEDWDARQDQIGWDTPGFADQGWLPASVMDAPTGVVRGITHAAPPLRLIETRPPVHATRPKPGLVVYNLGQNAPYVPELVVQGPAGTTVQCWPAEQLKPDGTMDQETMRPGKHISYVLRGGGVETWHPAFWYVGSQFWQINATGPDGKPIDPATVLRGFRGLMVNSSSRPTSSFNCSNPLLNQIYELIRWAIQSNLASVITDCPHREKSGWLEEDHLMGPGLMYCYDMRGLFNKITADMEDAQHPDGRVPTMAPEYFFYDGGFSDSVEWGGAFLLVPDQMRGWYADHEVIHRHLPAMARYVDYLASRAPTGLLSGGLGDWDGGGTDARTPAPLTDTAYFYALALRLSQFYAFEKASEPAARYAALADKVKAAFNKAYLVPATGKYATGSQSCQATALDLGLVPAEVEGLAYARMLDDIKAHDYAVFCGEVGHPSMLRVLAAHGDSRIITKIHLQTDKPGYGFQVKKGLTTLAESWDARPISLNHFMLGHLMEWLFADLGGIQPGPASGTGAQDGFQHFVIAPSRSIPSGEVAYDSVRGTIRVGWNQADAAHFAMTVTIPPNCEASIHIPGTLLGVAFHANPTQLIPVRKPTDGVLVLPAGTYDLSCDTTGLEP